MGMQSRMNVASQHQLIAGLETIMFQNSIRLLKNRAYFHKRKA
jgi:hypothetical protein